jgi:dimethylargininase
MEQHRAYCDALSEAGLEVLALPPDEAHADSCFVEDTAIVRGDVAVIGRFGVESRRGEEEEVASLLARHKTVKRISGEATLEGGDVLQAGDLLFAGISQRTSWPGINELAGLLGLSRYRLVGVTGALHLKSLCTHLGKGVTLVAESCAWRREFNDFEVIAVPVEESYAANAVAVEGTVLVASGFPRTRRLIGERGFVVREMEMSEFRKGDGGLTCLSIIW